MKNKKYSILGIVPARGGSKGILRKNIQNVAGKPLIAYTIENALHTSEIDRLIVSTDDTEISKIAKKVGAEVNWRPPELSTDFSSSESALLYVLNSLEIEERYLPEIVVFLQCTSPLTISEDIDGTIRTLIEENADCALSVASFHNFLWKKSVDGNAIGINHDKCRRLLRQEQDPQYIETGAVYAMRADGFKKAKHRFFGKTALYVMPKERCLEIDDPVDLELAEFFLRKRKAKLYK